MRLNRTLTIIAIVYLLINGLFFLHASSLSGGASMGYIFIYPAFWIITFIVVLVLCIKNRKTWFSKNMILSTVISILFCTPIAFSLIVYSATPASYLASSSYNPENGIIKKSESWNYYGGTRSAEKFWRKKDDSLYRDDDKDFKRDSTWVYFNRAGDTMKTETYKDDKLIYRKIYK